MTAVAASTRANVPAVRGHFFSTDASLPEGDLQELSDLLAAQLYASMEHKVYSLARQDVAELIQTYIADLTVDDQRSVVWLVWDLFQEGMRIEMNSARRRR